MTVKTGRLAPEAVMVVAGEDFASLWSVLIFPFLIQLLQVFSNLFSSHFSS